MEAACRSIPRRAPISNIAALFRHTAAGRAAVQMPGITASRFSPHSQNTDKKRRRRDCGRNDCGRNKASRLILTLTERKKRKYAVLTQPDTTRKVVMHEKCKRVREEHVRARKIKTKNASSTTREEPQREHPRGK